MKKVNLYELFGHLDSKDVLLTDIKSDSVNCDEEKIRNMTLKKVHQNMKQQKQVRFLRTMKRLAAGFVLAAILGGGAYAVASEELGWSIKKMFGLNEKEVLTSDQKISTDDYSLSLVDMAYDGNIGRILIKLEALTKELGIKRLSEQGIKKEDFDMLADDVLKEPVLNFNPRQGITKEDVLAILEKAY